MKRISTILNNNSKQATNKSESNNLTFFKSTIQPKLTINQPNDIYEQEADAMAERVMKMPVNRNESSFFKPANLSFLQRKCIHCVEEEKLQMKSEGSASTGMEAPSVVHDVIKSGGQPLYDGTRGFMESRFGYDFGNVQVHNDSLANQSSGDINALAYTHGNHVVFGTGKYQPNTDSGKQLLAHELTHVVQQQTNDSLAIQKSPDDTGDKYKRKPPGKGAFTQADYDAWVRKHPKHTFYNGGPHEPDSFYNRYTPEWFWKNGYFYAFSRYGGFKGAYFEVWLSNKENGKEFSVFRGDLSPSSGKQASPASTTTPAPATITNPAENPDILDPGGDFEKMFGEEIRSLEDTSVLNKQGDATEYADGTIVFFDEEGEMTIYKPSVDPDYEGAYETYDNDGEKTNEVVIGLEPENIFYVPDDSE